jgi:hypothetical protein
LEQRRGILQEDFQGFNVILGKQQDTTQNVLFQFVIHNHLVISASLTKQKLNCKTAQVALLLCIQGLLGSKLGPETSYTACGISWLSSVPHTNERILPEIRPHPLLSKSFQFITYQLYCPLVLQSLSYSQ